MTLQNLYIKLKKNKITKTQFLNEVRKDPFASKFVSPMNSYVDAIKILKAHSIIYEVKSQSTQFNLDRYIREFEDSTASEDGEDQQEKPQPKEEPEENESNAELPADLDYAVSKFIARIEQTTGYDDSDNIAMMIEKFLKALNKGKQTSVAILNSVKSKII